MIEWVKTQLPDEPTDCDKMLSEIKEDWYIDHCVLCDKYFYYDCYGCPLLENGNSCADNSSCWNRLADSLTWAEWLINAQKMLDLFDDLRGETK